MPNPQNLQNPKNKDFNIKIYFTTCLIFMTLFDFTLTDYILNNISSLSDCCKYVNIVYIENTGAAFSFFEHSTVLLIIISLLAVLYIIWKLLCTRVRYSPAFYFFISILSAGIFCNTFERITLGYVRDFISLKYPDFPVFNISDILINLGVFAIICLIITKKYLKK